MRLKTGRTAVRQKSDLQRGSGKLGTGEDRKSIASKLELRYLTLDKVCRSYKCHEHLFVLGKGPKALVWAKRWQKLTLNQRGSLNE